MGTLCLKIIFGCFFCSSDILQVFIYSWEHLIPVLSSLMNLIFIKIKVNISPLLILVHLIFLWMYKKQAEMFDLIVFINCPRNYQLIKPLEVGDSSFESLQTVKKANDFLNLVS